MTETIEWHPASEPPDNDRTVLVKLNHGQVAWIGQMNMGMWYAPLASFSPKSVVTHWAELPRGPQA